MRSINERVARVEEVSKSAHKRLDEADIEIKSLRDAKHEHSNQLQRHAGIIASISKLPEIVERLEKTVMKFVYMAAGGVAVGGIILGMLIWILDRLPLDRLM